MFRLLLAVLSAACALGGQVSPRLLAPFPDGRIVGGKETTVEAVPWQAALLDRGHFACGGSIVSATYVISAAHCIGTADDLTVRTGSSFSSSSEGTVTQVKRAIRHSLYNHDTVDYDIGLIELSTPLVFGTTQQPIPLVLQDQALADNANAHITGWGSLTEGGFFSAVLQEVTVPIVNQQSCNTAYNGAITARMFCAGIPEGGKDACQGDSGGPVVVNGQLVGIVSWGRGCARAGYPGVYTRVASVRKWWDDNSK